MLTCELFDLSGILGLLGATTSTGSVFSTPATTSQTVGLGGVDPKTSTATSGQCHKYSSLLLTAKYINGLF